jgi:hypothetical protein
MTWLDFVVRIARMEPLRTRMMKGCPALPSLSCVIATQPRFNVPAGESLLHVMRVTLDKWVSSNDYPARRGGTRAVPFSATAMIARN